MQFVMDAENVDDLVDRINDIADDSEELMVAIAALVISLVALVAAVLQVAQQYYASATGYANCDEKVMGQWSKSKVRVLRPYEFRFEVQYEAPVIFLCSPDNESGPVKGPPPCILDGSIKSQKESLAELETEVRSAGWTKAAQKATNRERKKEAKEQIHTADNELASWVNLLIAIQRMEHESKQWQRRRLQSLDRPPNSSSEISISSQAKSVEDKHTLVVALQKKRKSWDTMPAGVKKPYATTTWCHMIEMAAVLGIYWIEFDRSHDRYRAEGNGYMLTGEKISDLGIMFTFQVYGKTSFQETRTIPVEEVKDLSFGAVPTVYRRPHAVDSRRLGFANDNKQDLSMISLASRAEMAATLVLIGCNTNTVNYFAREDHLNMRVTHLFPIAFEIVGMLARTLHIEQSIFRVLPNPTIYHWNTKTFNLGDMLRAFVEHLSLPISPGVQGSEIIRAIQYHGKRILKKIQSGTGSGWASLVLLDSLHRALDDMDEVLTAKRKEDRPHAIRKAPGPIANGQLARLDSQSETQPTETETEKVRRLKVQDVLRSHIQEVLSGLNDKQQPPPPAAESQAGPPKPRFEEIDSVAPEVRQNKLMQVYFQVVRVKVLETAEQSTKRRQSESPQPQDVPVMGIKKRPTERSVREDAVEDDDDDDEPRDLCNIDTGNVSHEDIWCTLVFRMICWLMLHDFDHKDVQITKSELRGSRLPVYIA